MRASSKNSRWLCYVVIGLIFGVLDWYIVEGLADAPWPEDPHWIPIMVGVSINWGVWLVPAIPVAYVEVRQTGKPLLSALAVACLWFCAITGYYLYYGFLMAFDSTAPHSIVTAITQPNPTGWRDWGEILLRLTLAYIREWGGFAIISGAGVGGVVGVVYRRISASTEVEQSQ